MSTDSIVTPARPAGARSRPGAGELTEQLLATPVWSDKLVRQAGIPVVDTPFVTIGGGMGSFAMVDVLRIAGVPAPSIKVLTTADTPWENYAYLTGVSQLPPTYRIRSDASSMPDNLWGFPSYAVRRALSARSVREVVAPLWNVLTENILTDYWTPLAGEVFAGMQREADRIGYWQTRAKGRARMVRRRDRGGYFSVLRPDGGAPPAVCYRSAHVHLAVGYPSIRFLPDLREYRQRYRDSHRFVNAYEPHERVYQALAARPGTVLVRGGGVTASAILHRLLNDRERFGRDTRILHVLRNYVAEAHGPSVFMRRRGGHGWAHQGFNWPKASWGGQLKAKMETLEGEQRRQLWQHLGGSTTPRRKGWQRQLRQARADGVYHTFSGEIDCAEPTADGRLAVVVRDQHGPPRRLVVDFVIDATGLVGQLEEHRLLNDLVTVSGVGRNLLGRLDVTPRFEVRSMRSGQGRMFAAGAATEGAYYAAVDSLLGLQYAALCASEQLAGIGFCRRISSPRSMAQWWKWLRNEAP